MTVSYAITITRRPEGLVGTCERSVSAEATMAKQKTFKPGDRVRFSSKYLRSTGQVAGNEGQRRFTIRACECEACRAGRLVATDQEQPMDYLRALYTEEEIRDNPSLAWRHVNAGNLESAR